MAEQREPSEPTQERARRTRRAIMLAAAEAFAEQGYPATTTSDIANRAGVTKGAVAFHFPAKAHVAVAIVEDCYERWSGLARQQPAPSGRGVLDRIGEIFIHVAGQIRDDPIVRATVRLQAERAQITEPLRVPYVDWFHSVADLLRTAEARGELRAGQDVEALARAIVAGFQGVQHVSGVLSQYADVVERVAEFWDVAHAGVAAPAGR